MAGLLPKLRCLYFMYGIYVFAFPGFGIGIGKGDGAGFRTGPSLHLPSGP